MIHKTEERTTTEEVVESIKCNKCGRIISLTEQKDFVEIQEMFSYYFTGGYGSVFGDECSYRIDLCQNCFKELLGDYLEDLTERG